MGKKQQLRAKDKSLCLDNDAKIPPEPGSQTQHTPTAAAVCMPAPHCLPALTLIPNLI